MDADGHQPLYSPGDRYNIELPKYRRPGEPGRYRLTSARLGAPKPKPPATPMVRDVLAEPVGDRTPY